MTDGGPAFPQPNSEFIDHPVHGIIHRAQVGMEALPGMSLRDWFAGQALVCMGSWVPGTRHDFRDPASIQKTKAEWAYGQADAMLAARSNPPATSE